MLEIEVFVGERASPLKQDVNEAVVQDNRILTTSIEPEKGHMGTRLPPNMPHEPRDYLTILPLDPEASIGRLLRRYHMPWDATITIRNSGQTNLPNTYVSRRTAEGICRVFAASDRDRRSFLT